MIRIKADKDGRLTQWDKARNVIITGLDSIEGVKVHFSSPTDNHDAYVVEPVENDGVVSAAIPDELLTIAGTIWVYVYPDSYTKSSAVLSVMRREKPDDYTYGGGGAPQVQTDWNQNDTTAKDYIKNRPGGYEEGFDITWDGDTTGRVSIAQEGMPGGWYKVSDKILTADQIIGSQITTVQNGEAMQDVITDDMYLETEFGCLLGYVVMVAMKTGAFNVDDSNISIPEPGIYFTSASAEGHSMFVSSLSNLTVRPFDDKYIPDTVARKDEVYTKDEIYTNYNHTISITWDGNKDGKDTFLFNAFNYYKISDEVPVFKRIQSVSTSSNGSSELSELYEGENCYRAGFSIVVTKAGACRLAANEGDTMLSFTAPSTGIYFWTNDSINAYQTSLKLTSFIEQDGIIVNSPSKKWKIAVDDTGTISATEITA